MPNINTSMGTRFTTMTLYNSTGNRQFPINIAQTAWGATSPPTLYDNYLINIGTCFPASMPSATMTLHNDNTINMNNGLQVQSINKLPQPIQLIYMDPGILHSPLLEQHMMLHYIFTNTRQTIPHQHQCMPRHLMGGHA